LLLLAGAGESFPGRVYRHPGETGASRRASSSSRGEVGSTRAPVYPASRPAASGRHGPSEDHP
jgi:hypothetical protein